MVLAGLVWQVVVLLGLQEQAAGLTMLPAVPALLLLFLLVALLLQEPLLLLVVLLVPMALPPADNTKQCCSLPPETIKV